MSARLVSSLLHSAPSALPRAPVSAFPRAVRSFSAMMAISLDSPSSSSSKPQILLADDITLAKDALASFSSSYDVLPLTSSSRDEFLSDLKGKYAGIKGIYRHFNRISNKVVGRYDEEVLKALPEGVKIASNGAGYDFVDVQAATERRIQVANVPTVVDAPTADTALFLLLGAIRQFGRAQANLYSGKWHEGYGLSNDPAGKVLGIVGMGGIGRAFATRARALGMTVVYHNRNQLTPDLEDGATYLSTLDELLRTADVVSLNLPLNAKTKHTMGAEQFKAMKKSAILVNTARGGVVDEQALVEALESGEIAGCGLDVYENEPKVHEGLLKSEKAFLLPHVGTLTVETQREMEATCLRNLSNAMETGKLAFTVPEQKGVF